MYSERVVVLKICPKIDCESVMKEGFQELEVKSEKLKKNYI